VKRAYYTFIAKSGEDFLVYVPDMDIYTEGTSVVDAMEMARDAIGLKGIAYEDDGRLLPETSSAEDVIKKAKEDTEIFDYSKGILTLVDVNFDEYKKKMMNRAVKKNCTLPYWLSKKAEEENVNFSKILQEALMEKLNIQ